MNRISSSSSGRAARAPFLCVFASSLFLLSVPAADFSELEPLFQEHCVECHGAKEPDGELTLETYEALLKGGESGPVVVPGKSTESLLVQALEGNWGKTGKNQFMPPGKREKLKPEQVALFKAWIDAGAPAPKQASVPKELTVPKIATKGAPRRPVNALAFEPKSRLLAVARPDAVELLNADSRAVVRSLTGFRGAANAVCLSSDGQFVFAGAGDATGGQVLQWRVADESLVRTLGGHHDAVYALALTADDQTLASGSYDYAIRLWNLADGTERHTISANQGAIMGLAFRPDGKVLASASYDRTAKVYDPTTGTRLETFGQALKELSAVAFSPDGKTLLTGGSDNRLRAYRIGPDGKEGSNELLATVFAHEGAILRVVFSPDGKTVATTGDDKTVKLFDAAELKQRLALEAQPDWPTALAFAGNDVLAVGRADGSLAFYNTSDGKPAQPPKPELIRTEPRGVQRGTAMRVKFVGKHLGNVTVASVYRDGRLWAALTPLVADGEVGITLEPTKDEKLGDWEITVGNGTAESGRVKVWVDDLPQVSPAADSVEPLKLPASVWRTLENPGDSAEFTFEAVAGRTLVFDLSAQRLGAKGDFTLALLDADGRTLASNDTYQGQSDPLLIHRFDAAGWYRVRVTEVTYAGSPEHYFRLSIGELPFVTGLFPLSLPSESEVEAAALGVNLPENGRLKLKSGSAGELALSVPAKEWRSRRDWKFLVSEWPTAAEMEPNDAPAQATKVPVPVSANARLMGTSASVADTDIFQFTARKGVTYVVETTAAMLGSLADTRIEILWPDGRPVERVRLQAVRNSAVTFRPETSDESGIRFDNWEEMELNDLLWCGGEVMKLFRHAQGPDSDLVLYTSSGKRRGYFDTTPTGHYLDEPVYVVVPLAPGEKAVPNGLPVFTVNYANEDAALRDIGTDSRVHFTAPADSDFLVRVGDARGFGGDNFGYRLVVREARPDFKVTLNGANPTVAAGSGQGFSVVVDRVDGFEGAVTVEFNHLPAGWTVSNPLVIEAGHREAQATVNAATNAVSPADADWDAVTVVATAEVEGRPVAMRVNNLGRPKLAKEPPKLLVRLEPVNADASDTNGIVLHPGGTARAKLSIVRNGLDGVVTFGVDNLPHGVIVENLGLNGITFLAGENEREISLAAARWVGELERPFYAVENQAGRQTSHPVWLRLKRSPAATARQ
jgi:WD40 repeat protein/mono/diheme cytochrome c family protein